jgi:hypothetical protein
VFDGLFVLSRLPLPISPETLKIMDLLAVLMVTDSDN